MAPPVIIAAVPAEGPAAGRTLVRIRANNLRPQTSIQPTAEVLFGSSPATAVRVFTRGSLTCLAPASTPGDVDVSVTNLDDAGVPIPGETTVAADAYRYAFPDLTADSTVKHITKMLRRRFADQVLANTLITEDVEYDAETGDMMDRTEIAKVPAIAIAGPRFDKNAFYSDYTRDRAIAPDSSVTIRRPAYISDLIYDLFVYTDTKAHALSLPQAVALNIERRPILDVPCDPDDPGSDLAEFDLDFTTGGEFRLLTRPNRSNLQTNVAEILVRGVRIEDQLGFPTDLSVERSFQISETNIPVSTL